MENLQSVISQEEGTDLFKRLNKLNLERAELDSRIRRMEGRYSDVAEELRRDREKLSAEINGLKAELKLP
ncbi:MAG: hypothetical protein WCX88_01325 [Patescibacteria group bacterium]